MKNFSITFVFLLFSVCTFAAEVTQIDNGQLQELLDKDVPLVDVRATSEWQETGVIPGSHLMMFYDEKGNYNLNSWLSELSAVASKDKPLVLICHSGGRSEQLAKYLTKVVGYKEVYNVKHGIAHWIKNNNPTITPNR